MKANQVGKVQDHRGGGTETREPGVLKFKSLNQPVHELKDANISILLVNYVPA